MNPHVQPCDRRLDMATPFHLVAKYDRMRLATYCEHGTCGPRISIRSTEQAVLLRFADVGYFNTVYSHDADVIKRLSEVELFYHGSPHGCRLVTSFLTSGSPHMQTCTARGWLPDVEYAWLSADARMLSQIEPVQTSEIRRPRIDEQELFFRIYLTAFGAASDRISAAIDNMRHLFSNPNLHFLFTCENDQPVGVGMMYHIGHSALLCAGAMLPSARGAGGHNALLAARIRLAASLGCTDIHSWAIRGSSSHRNIEQAGLQTVDTTLSLQFPPGKLAQ